MQSANYYERSDQTGMKYCEKKSMPSGIAALLVVIKSNTISIGEQVGPNKRFEFRWCKIPKKLKLKD